MPLDNKIIDRIRFLSQLFVARVLRPPRSLRDRVRRDDDDRDDINDDDRRTARPSRPIGHNNVRMTRARALIKIAFSRFLPPYGYT